MKCKNCGSEVTTNYCPECGQESNIHRLTVKEIFVQFFQVITKADSSLPGFIKDLFIKPGVVAREYAEGKRMKYYNPFRYLIFVVGIYALLSLVNLSQNYDTSINDEEVKKFADIQEFYNKNHKTILLFSLPLSALISYFMFFKSGFNYAENLLLNILIEAQLILFNILIITPLIILSKKLDEWLFLAYLIISLFYFVAAYTQFFPGKKILVILKSVICFFIINLVLNLLFEIVFIKIF